MDAPIRPATRAEAVRATIARVLGYLGPTLDTQELVRDLGADSLDLLDLSMSIEEDFAIRLDDAAVEAWRTVGDVVRTVEGTKP